MKKRLGAVLVAVSILLLPITATARPTDRDRDKPSLAKIIKRLLRFGVGAFDDLPQPPRP